MMNSSRFPGKVPESVVRATAIEVCIISIITLITGSPWLALLLVADFAARAFFTPKLSPLAALSRKVWVPAFKLQGPGIFYTPKRFAAQIGFTMALIGAVLFFFEMNIAGAVALGFLTAASFLEGAFRYCLGCKIFGFLAGRGFLDASDCPNCVY